MPIQYLLFNRFCYDYQEPENLVDIDPEAGLANQNYSLAELGLRHATTLQRSKASVTQFCRVICIHIYFMRIRIRSFFVALRFLILTQA